MRQVLLRKDNVFLHDMPEPLPTEHMMVVAVHYSFISTGTESATIAASGESLLAKIAKKPGEIAQKVYATAQEHGIQGTLSLIQEKLDKVMPLGYSCSGQVIHVGSKIKKFRVGDFVACGGSAFAHHAELITVPENLAVKVSNYAILKEASITTIGSIALQGVRRAQLQLGETVVIIGLGLIGLLTVQLAKRSGCRVIAIDIVDDRLRRAQYYGADVIINAANGTMVNDVLFATQHYGADTTIITAAAQSGEIIQKSMEITRRKGKVVLVGDVKLDFERSPFYEKEIDFMISCSYGPGRYDDDYELSGHDYPYAYVRWTENRNMQLFVELLNSKSINVSSLISNEVPISDVQRAYAALKNSTSLGVVLSYDRHDQRFEVKTQGMLDLENEKTVDYVPSKHNLPVGIIGAGGFARVKLLPLLHAIESATIRSIIDIDTVNCINLARHYGALHISNSYQKVIIDDAIKVVVISTPHYLHASQAIDCLKAGKAVFVEKPAAVTKQQLKQLKEFLQTSKTSLYCVDFNRSFSPFMQHVKEVVKDRSNPLVIHYRMNAQFIPLGHWIQSDENGGRVIGEACHIFELFSFLTGAIPVALSVSALNGTPPYLATDNLSVQMRMSDGSLCNFVYTALGNPKVNKEYMEIFFDGKTIIMDDYVQLKGFGLPMSFNKKVSSQDKGHEALMRAFFKAAQTSPVVSPIPFERISVATEVSIIVTELARQGGGYMELHDLMC